VIVEDNVVCFTALLTAGAPFVRIVSLQPPRNSGSGCHRPMRGCRADDSSQWGRRRSRSTSEPWTELGGVPTPGADQGAPALPYLEFIRPSDELNLYVYPEILDYDRAHTLEPELAATRIERAID